MNGALMKGSSRFAVAAALGLFMGASSSQAADLGGNCCADLEERIAELEATTARKGNRKMSLQITGQVHRMVLWYDDGHSSNTYYGIDNTNASSRFIFLGSAKVTPKVTMGFEIAIEVEAGGTSSKLNQFDEDGKVGAQIGGPGSFNQAGLDAYFGDARRVAWFMEHADLGRLTVGRWEGAMVFSTVDLTGHVALAASGSFVNVNGAFFVRGNTGQVYAITVGNLVDPAAAQSERTELIRYDSAVWNGFTFASQLGEAGDFWGSQIRYAGEHAGFRLAGVVGYERVTDVATPAAFTPATAAPGGLIDPAFLGRKPDITSVGIALSAMHVPTGVFVQGHYNATDYGGQPLGAASGYWGEGTVHKKDTAHWLLQVGVSKNWFGYGATSSWGEYGVATDFGADITCGTTAAQCGLSAIGSAGRSFNTGAGNGFSPVNGVTDTETTIWGLGIAQRFDAAATDLYVGYRRFDMDVTCTGAGANCQGAAVAGAAKKLPTESLDILIMGARVLF